MLVYWIFFILSFLFIAWGNKLEKKGSKKYVFLEIIGLVLLAFLASIRGISIGTDLAHYVKPVFNATARYGLSGNYYFKVIEVGYVFFNYIISLFCNNFNVFLFILQFFILAFSYYGLKKINPNHSLLIYMLFIILYYNKSLNVVRQSMALSLILFSFQFLFKKQSKKFLFIVFLAFLFHRSAIVAIFMYPLFSLITSSKENVKYTFVALLIILFIVFAFFDSIFAFLINTGVLPTRYMSYLTSYYNNQVDFEIVDLVLDVCIAILYMLFSKLFQTKEKYSKFYFFLLIIDIVFLIIGGKYSSVNRIGLYFRLPAILYFLSNFSVFIKENNTKSLFSSFLVLLIATAYWGYIYGYVNNGETVPYVVDSNVIK